MDEHHGIIEVKSHGVVSKDDIAESIRKVGLLHEDKGINRILVDTTGQEKMPDTIDTFNLFSTFPQNLRVAMLLQKYQATAEDIQFAETAGVNRCICLQIFQEREEALKWLNK